MDQHVKVVIGLGSNVGDRLKYLKQAAEILAFDCLENAQSSSVYESPPWGPIVQGDFLNAVLVGVTEWKPPALVNYLKGLERKLGRSPGPLYGPREIDLDLIAYGKQEWKTDGVTVPHPRLASRDFVLLPLREVWPAWVHPAQNQDLEELWQAFLKTQRSCAKMIAPPLLNTKNP